MQIEVEMFNINENVKKVTSLGKNVIGALAVGRQLTDTLDDNLVKKVHIGKGSVSLKSVAPKFGNVHSVSIPLKHNGKKKTMQQGTVELDVMVEVIPARHTAYGDEDGADSGESSFLHQLQLSVHEACMGLYASTCQPCVEHFTRPQESLASQADTEDDGAEMPVRKQSMQRERFNKKGFVPLRET